MDPDKIFATLVENGRWLFPLLAALFVTLLLTAIRLVRSRRAKWLTGAPLALLAGLMLFGFVFATRVQAYVDQRTSELSFELLQDGRKADLAGYRGQVVVLNYWATWCPPCRAEMPDLDRLAKTYKDRGLAVLALSDEKPEKIAKYRAENTFEALAFALFKDQPPADWIGRQAYAGRPTTVVIDREGKARRLLIGGQSYESFEAAIQPLL
jgi:thiol-disulfide isomerase/thioredoxin